MKLLVAIPTWNRADYLNKAIGAIAAARARARSCEVELFVSDNCSTDHTAELVAQWQKESPWVHHRRWEEHTSAQPEWLRRALTGSGLDYDYVWLQGDDDWITDSSAYAWLQEAIEADPENPPAIVHCCQTRRALPGDTRIIGGTVEDLCNTYGWHDLLGWISSLVISRHTVEKMVVSPQLDVPAPSSFCHAEALLEAAYGEPMLLLTSGLIDPQDVQQTVECMERWKREGVAEAYWRVIPGLLNLKKRGVLKTPLALGFFRYLAYSFWDRFAVEVMAISADINTAEERIDAKLKLLGFFSLLIGYGEDRKLYENWLDGFKDDISEVRRANYLIQRRIKSSERASYSFSLLPE